MLQFESGLDALSNVGECDTMCRVFHVLVVKSNEVHTQEQQRIANELENKSINEQQGGLFESFIKRLFY
jgi:hypothetical protein